MTVDLDKLESLLEQYEALSPPIGRPLSGVEMDELEAVGSALGREMVSAAPELIRMARERELLVSTGSRVIEYADQTERIVALKAENERLREACEKMANILRGYDAWRKDAEHFLSEIFPSPSSSDLTTTNKESEGGVMRECGGRFVYSGKPFFNRDGKKTSATCEYSCEFCGHPWNPAHDRCRRVIVKTITEESTRRDANT